MIELLFPSDFAPVTTSGKYQLIKGISLNGNDCTVQIVAANRDTPRTSVYQIVFTGSNVNGLITHELTIVQNVSFRGFSRTGWKCSGVWSRPKDLFFMLCGTPILIGTTDIKIQGIHINACKTGPVIGTDAQPANMTFVWN